MADIKLFNLKGTITEYQGSNVTLEKELQGVIENNMDKFFGVRFLASEYTTTNGGRMDSLGLDENNCPVIFEYKRATNENVINQGLFYLNWLLDHKDSFKVLVIEKFGMKIADLIDWSMPRVICIAGDFTKYDESAIKQMNRNISLIRYKKFGSELLMFEQLDENIVKPIDTETTKNQKKHTDKSFDEQYAVAEKSIQELYEEIRDYILHLGDDITENKLKLYMAFKKIKNVVCIELAKTKVILNIQLDPSTIQFEEGFSRDTTNIGHWGTGNVQVWLKNKSELEKTKALILRAYNEN